MRYGFLAARELNVCAKFQVSSSKTVSATLRTYKHIPYIHIQTYSRQTERWNRRNPGQTKYVADLRTGQYTVQFRDYYWFVKGTSFPLIVSIFKSRDFRPCIFTMAWYESRLFSSLCGIHNSIKLTRDKWLIKNEGRQGRTGEKKWSRLAKWFVTTTKKT